WRIDGELSLAKVITSSSSFSSNRPGIDRTVLAKGLYQVLDREVGAAYQQHGWLPTLNVYLVYQLCRRNKYEKVALLINANNRARSNFSHLT
ncbi:hypothetical protein, partial [Adhaeribacter pallidiroseus]|uniref:hypothetical protein n=1 Tax=Adhaeribacter pallidiroseus TaxID=2072847 RepID=UPI00131446C9